MNKIKVIHLLFDRLMYLFSKETFSVSEEPEGFMGFSEVKVHKRPWRMLDGKMVYTDCICKKDGRLFCTSKKEGMKGVNICVDELHKTQALLQVYAQLVGAFQAFDMGRRRAPWYDPETEEELYKDEIQECYERMAMMVAKSIDGLRLPAQVICHEGILHVDNKDVEPLAWPFYAIPLIREQLKKFNEDLATAVIHYNFQNRWALIESTVVGCYNCGRIFHPIEITDWMDEGQTACCPYCGIDSVVLEGEGFNITKKLLQEVYRKAF